MANQKYRDYFDIYMGFERDEGRERYIYMIVDIYIYIYARKECCAWGGRTKKLNVRLKQNCWKNFALRQF